MAKVEITIACQPYDRVQPLINGAVEVEGCVVHFLPLRAEETFHRAYNGAEFEVCELSMSSYVLTLARDINKHVAIPVFPSRMFRHSAIYVRNDRQINQPSDLIGKTVGVPEYQMTAALWARGMLADEYGVDPIKIKWRTGGLEQPGRKEKFGLTFGGDLEVIPADAGQTLSAMLNDGALDALITARAPSCFTPGAKHLRRLFADYRAAEEAYFSKTRIYPIMHVIGIRRDIVERYPWLPVSLTKAFEQAKKMCLEAMFDVGTVSASLPWLADDVARTITVMGEDYWPYGVEANRPTLEAMLRYSYDQRLAPRRVEMAELFAPGTYESFKV